MENYEPFTDTPRPITDDTVKVEWEDIKWEDIKDNVSTIKCVIDHETGELKSKVMFQKVTVKQLIGMLLDCDLNSYVELQTENKDKEGRYHAYHFTGVKKEPTMDSLTGELYTKLCFHNGDFEREN